MTESQRQAWFENAVKKKLEVPNNYEQVAVLIMRWHPDVDDHGVKHDVEVSCETLVQLHGALASTDLDVRQIEELMHVFERFGFSITPVVCLHTETENPQHTFNAAVAQHVANNDGDNRLLIIYYVGCSLQLGSDKRMTFAA